MPENYVRVYDRRIMGEPHYRGPRPFIAEARGPGGLSKCFCRTFQDARKVAVIIARQVGAPCEVLDF